MSLSSYRHEPKSEINKPFVPETTVSACVGICIIVMAIQQLIIFFFHEYYPSAIATSSAYSNIHAPLNNSTKKVSGR